MEQINITCTRCNGTGKFSFNLKDGSKCYGCNGTGEMIAETMKVETNKFFANK